MAGFDGTRPIFLQLAEMLEEGIISAALKINPATALKGINLLVDEGLVYKKRGVGMFVATGARDALLQKRRESFYTERVRPVAREASSLGLTLPELTGLVERAYNDEEKE